MGSFWTPCSASSVDKDVGRLFLRRLLEVMGSRPQRVTTDKHPSSRRAIRWIIGRKAWHRSTRYLNNYTEQSHRGVKQRYYPVRGFGDFESASRFCAAFEEMQQYFRVRRRGEPYPHWLRSGASSSRVGAR